MRSIRLKQAPTKPVLVVSHEQWRRLEEALTYPPVMLYARLNVTTWARRCEMIGFRPSDFDFGQQMLNVTRSTVYVNAAYHPSGRAGWFTKDHPKNGDRRRFAISKQMCVAVQEYIEEYGLGAEDLLFRSGCSPPCGRRRCLWMRTRTCRRWCLIAAPCTSTGRRVPR